MLTSYPASARLSYGEAQTEGPQASFESSVSRTIIRFDGSVGAVTERNA